MSGGDPTRRRCAPTPPPSSGSKHGGGYRWRDGVLAVLARARLRRRGRRAAALDLLRRRADPRLAGPGARHPARPAAARRADQPPRHPLAGVAGGLPRASSTPPSSSSPTTAGSWRRSAPRCSSWRRSGPASSPAPGTPGARSRRRARSPSARRSSASRRRSSGWSASSSASATRRRRRSQAQSRLKQIEKIKRDGASAEARDSRSLRFSFVAPERPGRVVLKLVERDDRGAGPDPARRRRTSNSSAASTSSWSAPTAPARRP